MDEGMMDVVHTAAHYHTYKHRKTRSIEQEKSTIQAKRAKHVGIEDRLVGGLGFGWILVCPIRFELVLVYSEIPCIACWMFLLL